jgi:hypothetical protein
MAWPLIVAGVSTALSMKTESDAGDIEQAGIRMEGEARQNVARWNAAANELEAVQMDRQASMERASAQRQAIEIRRQKRLAISRAMAVSGASGGGGIDSDVSLMDEIARMSEFYDYDAKGAMFEGEERALSYEDNAAMKRMSAGIERYEGNVAKTVSINRGKGAELRTASSIFSKGASFGMAMA